jgi:putative DNA primase/helicase
MNVRVIPTEVAEAPPTYILPNFDNMPAELKQRPNWVLWVAEQKGTKWTKVPVQPSGYPASTTNPRHWSSFDDARHAYECAVAEGGLVLHHKTGSQLLPIGGVGFVFDGVPDEDGLVLAGVDFDRVISADAQIAPLARERITRLGSYCEASVSGQGLHVIVKAHPLAAGIAHGGVELYTSGR